MREACFEEYGGLKEAQGIYSSDELERREEKRRRNLAAMAAFEAERAKPIEQRRREEAVRAGECARVIYEMRQGELASMNDTEGIRYL